MCKETAIRGIPQNSKGLGFIFLEMVKLITALFFLSWGDVFDRISFWGQWLSRAYFGVTIQLAKLWRFMQT